MIEHYEYNCDYWQGMVVKLGMAFSDSGIC